MKYTENGGESHFPVALSKAAMYNNKTRQAAAWGELPAAKPHAAKFVVAVPGTAEGSMYMMTALINILAISIILVLVLVLLVQKENSAFGHAPSKDVIAGFRRVSAESR